MLRKTLVCCSLLVFFGGCSKYSPQVFPKTYPVHGKVTLDGQPLTAGTVEFLVQAGQKGTGATGFIQKDGTFQMKTFSNTGMDGAVPGEYVVIVRMPEGPEYPNPKEYKSLTKIPPKYAEGETSGLKVTIKEGDNELEPFDLKSGD